MWYCWSRDLAQVVEHVAAMCEVLSLIPIITWPPSTLSSLQSWHFCSECTVLNWKGVMESIVYHAQSVTDALENLYLVYTVSPKYCKTLWNLECRWRMSFHLSKNIIRHWKRYINIILINTLYIIYHYHENPCE